MYFLIKIFNFCHCLSRRYTLLNKKPLNLISRGTGTFVITTSYSDYLTRCHIERRLRRKLTHLPRYYKVCTTYLKSLRGELGSGALCGPLSTASLFSSVCSPFLLLLGGEFGGLTSYVSGRRSTRQPIVQIPFPPPLSSFSPLPPQLCSA